MDSKYVLSSAWPLKKHFLSQQMIGDQNIYFGKNITPSPLKLNGLSLTHYRSLVTEWA